MSTNPTYTARCPISGNTYKRTSAHPYTHAVTTIVVRVVADQTEGRESISLKRRGQPIPAGFHVCRQPGRNCWGFAVHYTPRAPEAFVEEVLSFDTFHHSEKLARSAVRSYLANRPGVELVRECIVATNVVERTDRQKMNDAAEADAGPALDAADRRYRADLAALDAAFDAGPKNDATRLAWATTRGALHAAIKVARRELVAVARRARKAGGAS